MLGLAVTAKPIIANTAGLGKLSLKREQSESECWQNFIIKRKAYSKMHPAHVNDRCQCREKRNVFSAMWIFPDQQNGKFKYFIHSGSYCSL